MASLSSRDALSREPGDTVMTRTPGIALTASRNGLDSSFSTPATGTGPARMSRTAVVKRGTPNSILPSSSMTTMSANRTARSIAGNPILTNASRYMVRFPSG